MKLLNDSSANLEHTETVFFFIDFLWSTREKIEISGNIQKNVKFESL